MSLLSEKNEFIENEIILMSFFGAFGRANIYNEKASENKKKEFRKYLGKTLKNIKKQYIFHKVKSNKHIGNIAKISKGIPSEYRNILKNNEFRIGISQKLLNLYLKYLWAINWIKEPPHCPFDSRVISRLNINKKINFTEIKDMDDYKILVISAEEKAGKKSIAQWELELFNTYY